MRAISIDPMQRVVLEVEVDGGEDPDVASFLDAQAVEPVFVFETGDVLLLDIDSEARAQDALWGSDDASRAFSFDIGAESPFYGPALIVGRGSSHGWTDVAMTPERLSSIMFDEPEAAAADSHGRIN